MRAHEQAENLPPRDRGSRTILVVGVDGVMDKLCYVADELRATHGLHTVFYTHDIIGFSADVARRWGFTVHRASRWPLDVGRLVRLVRDVRPAHVEMYLGTRPWTMAGYVAVLRAMRVPYLLWLRGGELNWHDFTGVRRIRRLATRIALRFAARILIKEPQMRARLAELRLPGSEKVKLLHNRIPIGPAPSTGRGQEVLFLNSFRRMRRVELVLEAAAIVLRSCPDARFRLVGSTRAFSQYVPSPRDYEDELAAMHHRLGLKDAVSIEPFTADPSDHYHRAAVFLLPADAVFVNYSLLEAMERGVVPIVADAPGAREIVSDGVDGFVVEQRADAIAQRVIQLLTDPGMLTRMRGAARTTIQRRFNITDNVHELVTQVYPSLHDS